MILLLTQWIGENLRLLVYNLSLKAQYLLNLLFLCLTSYNNR